MQARVTRTSASVELARVASGTFSTRTSPARYMIVAFILDSICSWFYVSGERLRGLKSREHHASSNAFLLARSCSASRVLAVNDAPRGSPITARQSALRNSVGVTPVTRRNTLAKWLGLA